MTDANLGLDASRISYDNLTQGTRISDPDSSMNGYSVDMVFGSPTASGVTAYAMKNGDGDVVIAFRGTNDGADVVSDVTRLGYDQWEQIRSQVNDYLDTNWTGEVTFAGHSLGGALAQYAAYETAGREPGRKGDMNLYSYNGLGGRNGLEANEPGGYDAARLVGVNAEHYYNPEDIFPRMGGEHVGGETKRIPSSALGPDGLYTAHTLKEIDRDDLNDAVSGTPFYYKNDTIQQNPGDIPQAVVDFLIPIGELLVKPAVAWTPRDINDVRDAIASIPVLELAYSAALISDFLTSTAIELPRQLANAGAKAVTALVDATVRIVDAAVDIGTELANKAIDAIGRGINKIKDAAAHVWDQITDAADAGLTKIGEALDTAGDWLDELGDWLNPFNNDFEDAIDDSIPRLRDPIVLDLNGDGVRLISRADADVRFDFDGDGFTEGSGWLSPQDAFLAIDWNRDGKINDITELFGDEFTSGFAAMAALDTSGDGLLSAADAQWGRLRLWRDANTNGETDAGELLRLSKFKIESIDLNFTRVNFDAEANLISEKGVYTKTNGRSFEIADVWFDFNNVNSKPLSSVSVSASTSALPNLRGYGDVSNLHEAMEADAALKLAVQAVADIRAPDLTRLPGLVEEIVLRWLGTFDVDPTSRGPNVDARLLEALEAATGTPFDANGVTDPAVQSVAALDRAWKGMIDAISARLFAQSFLEDALPASVYKVENDRLYLLGNELSALNGLNDNAPTGDGAHQAAYWAAAMTVLRATEVDGGYDLSQPDVAARLTEILHPLGLSGFVDQLDDWQSLGLSGRFQGDVSGAGLTIFGDADDDITISGSQSQAIFANGGNDYIYTVATASQTIHGGTGRDSIRGGAYGDWIDGGTGVDVMLGQGGDDTYVVDNAADLVFESSRHGTDEVRASVNWRLGQFTENLTLTGTGDLSGAGNASDNVLTGNLGDNRLEGFGGNDRLDGGEGADLMIGGTGNDRYFVDNAGDRVQEGRNGGTDQVDSSRSHTLSRNVEHLTLLGTGNINGTGNALSNIIYGNAGNNVLDGGVSGSDQLYGGLGNDTYVLQSASARAYDVADGGVDTVRVTFSYTLGRDLERLVMLGELDIDGYGNGLNNRLTGNGGNNLLNGYAGADRMVGMGGDDTYHVDNAGDVVVEAGAGGDDQVIATISHTLADNVEDLTLTGTGPIDGTGNGGDNAIEGTSDVNTLSGLGGDDVMHAYGGDDILRGESGSDYLDGGLGGDIMRGGSGDDTYVVDNVGDRAIESANQGTDLVFSSISFILGNDVENLTLFGSGAIDGAGNQLDNTLIGNDSANVLDGKGGRDTMIGQSGNDIYLVDNVNDVVIELGGQGNDEVRSSVSFGLDEEIEALTLIGSATIDGTGNRKDNTLTGNAVRNVLDGRTGDDVLNGAAGNDRLIGGLGEDRLTGGSGADRFIFESAADSSSVNYLSDLITDFTQAQNDRVDLSAIDGDPDLAGLQGLSFVGTDAFTGVGQIRYSASSVETGIFVNLDSNLLDYEMRINLTGTLTLTSGDFIL